MDKLRIRDVEAKPGTRAFARIPIARRLIGTDVYVGVHLIAGARPGPTVGILIAVHGDEVFPIPALRDVLHQVDPRELSGNIVVVPVSNPVAFAAGTRQSPDLWGKTDLWHCFPGDRTGTITQQIAFAITSNVFPLLDIGLEFHSGGVGRIQNRVEYDGRVSSELKTQIFELAASFGAGLIHESPVPPDGPTGYLNAQGKPCFQIEIGGPFLSGPDEDLLKQTTVRGVTNVLTHLKMIPGKPERPVRQFWFQRAGVRFEANPMQGGYLLSRRRLASDIGKVIEEGELLGEMIDPYSYQVLEEIKAPVKGVLFFTRLSGPIEAGNKGFALAKLEAGRWVEGLSLPS